MKWIRGFRVQLILAILVLTAVAGFVAYTRSLSPGSAVATLPVPWTVGVLADRSDAQITLTAQVNTNGNPAIAELYLDESAPVDVLLYSSMADTPMGTNTTSFFRPVNNGFARAVDAQVGERPTPNGWFVGSFLLPDNFQKDDDGVYSVRLPSIFAYGPEDRAAPEAGAAGDGLITFSPSPVSGWKKPLSSTPHDYQDYGTKARLDRLYWYPGNLRCVVTLRDLYLPDKVRTGQMLTDLPSSGTLAGDDFTWNAPGSLSPGLAIERAGAQTTRGRWAFAAGILVATAAACLLALAQEAPKGPLPLRRRGTSPPAAGETAGSGERAGSAERDTRGGQADDRQSPGDQPPPENEPSPESQPPSSDDRRPAARSGPDRGPAEAQAPSLLHGGAVAALALVGAGAAIAAAVRLRRDARRRAS